MNVHITTLARLLTQAFDDDRSNASIPRADRKVVITTFVQLYLNMQQQEREQRAKCERERILAIVAEQFDHMVASAPLTELPDDWNEHGSDTLPVPDPSYRKSRKSTI